MNLLILAAALPADPFFIIDDMPWPARAIVAWLQSQPVLSALLLLMVLDTLSGVFVAILKKKLSSSVSWRGVCKKVIALLMVGVGAVLEPFAGGLPLSKLCCMFFLYNEALSILENSAQAGVPLPRALVDTLVKLRDGSSKDMGGGSIAPFAGTTVTTTVKTESPTPNGPAVVVEVAPIANPAATQPLAP